MDQQFRTFRDLGGQELPHLSFELQRYHFLTRLVDGRHGLRVGRGHAAE